MPMLMLALVRSCKMENVTFIEIDTPNGKEIHAIIDRGNGEFTSMPKSTYDAMQAEQSTPMVTDETATL
jgi:hypothetical protein